MNDIEKNWINSFFSYGESIKFDTATGNRIKFDNVKYLHFGIKNRITNEYEFMFTTEFYLN